MTIKTGEQFTVINPNVLSGYYDSTFNGELLTVSSTKVPKVRNVTGGSCYFAIFETGLKTANGHSCRFSVSLDQINRQNFKRVKN